MKKSSFVIADISRVNFYKGIAIIAVLCIHYLSSMPWGTFTINPHADFYIMLDQICRLSVPLFLALSGYGLTKKYSTEMTLFEFYTRRLVRLLPNYIFWSITLWLLFMQVPPWYSTASQNHLWQIIILGYADYHLYFIPLIFQLYLLFPLFLFLIKKYPIATVIGAYAIQLFCLHIFSQWAGRTDLPFEFNDQTQYALFIPWVGYFILGMYMATTNFFTTKIKKLGLLILVMTTLILAIRNAQSAVHGGLDPLYALKFTRYSIVLYASSVILFALSGIQKLLTLPRPIEKCITTLGVYSLLIYLSHTLFLRLYFRERYTGVTAQELLLGSGVLVVGLYISYHIEKKLAH